MNRTGYTEPSGNVRGFTLIEMLVSLTIMSMIMLLLASGFRLIASGRDSGSSRMEKLESINRVTRLFRRDVEGLRRIIYQSEKGIAFVFSGSSQYLSLVVSEPPYPALPGLYFVKYSLDKRGGSDGLVRSRTTYNPRMREFVDSGPANQVSMLGSGFSFRLAYGTLQENRIVWKDNWNESQILPDLVRLDIRDKNSRSPLTVPPIIVGVRIDAEMECIGGSLGMCTARTEGQLQGGLIAGQGRKEGAQ